MADGAPTILPDTDLTTLPRLPRGVGCGSSRVYLYDVETRRELKGHPLNGSGWLGTGAMVAHRGMYVEGTADHVTVVVWTAAGPRRAVVTADTFPGRRVAVKEWHGPDCPVNGWRLLAKGDGSKPGAAEPPAGVPEAAVVRRPHDVVLRGRVYSRMMAEGRAA